MHTAVRLQGATFQNAVVSITADVKTFKPFLCFVDRASRYTRVMKPTWYNIYLQIYWVTTHLHVSDLLVGSPSSGGSNIYTVDPRVTTKIFVLTYDQILSYDPRQHQRGEHISYITCSSLRALAVFALFCMRDHANSSYQSMYSINKYRVAEKRCVSLTARSSINQALRPAWRS
jgi:hypothetical protein